MTVVDCRRKMQAHLYDLFDLEAPTAEDGRSNFKSALSTSKLHMSAVAVAPSEVTTEDAENDNENEETANEKNTKPKAKAKGRPKSKAKAKSAPPTP